MANLKRNTPKRRNRRLALSGLESLTGIKNLNGQEVLKAFEKTGLVLLGFAGGKLVKQGIIKATGIELDEGFKRFISPLLKVGGGVVLATRDNQYIKYIGYGLAAEGLVEGVNATLGKGKDILDLKTLKGLSLKGILSGTTQLPVYDDPVELKLASKYTPDLPPLEGDVIPEEEPIDNEQYISGGIVEDAEIIDDSEDESNIV